jgi:hypothetical protein
VIDYEEFKECYKSMPWNRVQGLARLLDEIQATWKLFDEDGDGSITNAELKEVGRSRLPESRGRADGIAEIEGGLCV